MASLALLPPRAVTPAAVNQQWLLATWRPISLALRALTSATPSRAAANQQRDLRKPGEPLKSCSLRPLTVRCVSCQRRGPVRSTEGPTVLAHCALFASLCFLGGFCLGLATPLFSLPFFSLSGSPFRGWVAAFALVSARCFWSRPGAPFLPPLRAWLALPGVSAPLSLFASSSVGWLFSVSWGSFLPAPPVSSTLYI